MSGGVKLKPETKFPQMETVKHKNLDGSSLTGYLGRFQKEKFLDQGHNSTFFPDPFGREARKEEKKEREGNDKAIQKAVKKLTKGFLEEERQNDNSMAIKKRKLSRIA